MPQTQPSPLSTKLRPRHKVILCRRENRRKDDCLAIGLQCTKPGNISSCLLRIPPQKRLLVPTLLCHRSSTAGNRAQTCLTSRVPDQNRPVCVRYRKYTEDNTKCEGTGRRTASVCRPRSSNPNNRATSNAFQGVQTFGAWHNFAHCVSSLSLGGTSSFSFTGCFCI